MFRYCFGAPCKSHDSLNDIDGNPLYVNNKFGKIHEGVSFMISGTFHPNADRFVIDFCLENDANDVALRIAARLQTNEVGRNSRLNKCWDVEEVGSAVPITFDCCSPVQVQVLFTIPSIMVAVNGFHVGEYTHRMPFHDITSVAVKGDLNDIKVKRKIVTDYPERFNTANFVKLSERHAATGIYDPKDYEDEDFVTAAVAACVTNERHRMPLPYYASFPKGFFAAGYSMIISGKVRLRAQKFRVCLQVGQQIWPQPSVALLLEFEFKARCDGETGEPIVLRNSFANGHWGPEEKSELATGLRPEADFRLVIVRGGKCFEVYMNDKPMTEYPYTFNPKFIDTLVVSGDLLLFNIEIEESD